MNGCKIHGHFINVTDAEGRQQLVPCGYLSAGTDLDSGNIYGEKYRTIRAREQDLHRRMQRGTEVEDIVVEYQCEFEGKMKDPESDVYAFFQSRSHTEGELPPPLRPRSALRGGHTELYRMEAVSGPNYRIQYFDINSMYV